jgi:hypothetical protein
VHRRAGHSRARITCGPQLVPTQRPRNASKLKSLRHSQACRRNCLRVAWCGYRRPGGPGRNEVIEDLHHRGRALHLGKVPDASKHLEPTAGPGGMRGVTMVDRDDAVPLAPDRQGG